MRHSMEQKLQRFYDAFHYIVPYPYTILLESGKCDSFINLTKNKHYFFWILYIFLSTLHSVRTSISFASNASTYITNKEALKLTFHGVWTVAYIIILSQQLSFVATMKEVMQQGNGTFALCHCMVTDLKRPKLFEKGKRFREQFLLFFCYSTLLISLFCGFPVFLYFRGEMWHIGSYFYNFARHTLKLGDWMSAPFGMIPEFLYISNSCAANIFHLHINFLYIQTFSTIVSYLIGLPGVWRKRLEDLEMKMRVHKKLRILTTIYNNSYGKYYIPPITTTAGILSISGLFMAIKLSHLKNYFLTICGILSFVTCGSVLAIVTALSGCVHANSEKLATHLKSARYKGILERKIAQSFKVDAVKSGNFYEIRKITSLTVLGMVSNIAGSFLLSVSF